MGSPAAPVFLPSGPTLRQRLVEAMLARYRQPEPPPPTPLPEQEAQPQPLHIPGLDVAARTVWGEARGDPESLPAVAAVLVNRLRSGKHGETLEDVALQPKQFSAWNPGDPNRPKMLSVPEEDPLLARIRGIIEGLVSGEVEDPTGGAEFYFTGRTPSWDFRKLEPAGKLGAHRFFRRKTAKKRS